MVYDRHDPRSLDEQQRMAARDRDYRVWCQNNLLDPEDTSSMLAYERYWIELVGTEADYEAWSGVLGA